MKRERAVPVSLVCCMMALIITMMACQKDDNNAGSSPVKTEQSAQATQDNSQMMDATQEVVSATGTAFVNQGFNAGRVSSGDEKFNDDNGCQSVITSDLKIDRTHKDSIIYSGTITIDYGIGVNCDSLHLHKGKVMDAIILVFTFKDSLSFSSKETITFENYYKDSVQLDGTIAITSSSGSPTHVNISEAKIMYANGTSSTWNGSLVYTYAHHGDRKWCGNDLTVTGSWSGTSRSGVAFNASITKALEYKSGCFGKHKFIPVAGTISISSEGINSIVDYGDGSCDKTYTVTIAGTITTKTFG